MSLPSQAQRFQSEQELLRRERVQRAPQIPQNLDPNSNGKRDGAKGVPKLETVIPFGRVVELGKSLSILAPIEFSAIYDDSADRSAVSTDPFGG